MKNLNIGSIQIPINGATKTFAVLAKRGAGKTYTAAVMAEEFQKNSIPFVVFDPIDVWWGLRFNKDGKNKGLPVVVFGLEHADIKIDRDMGRKIAQAVVSKNISCVISTFGMPKVAQRHLIAEFSEEILNINNTPRHIFIEEAHEFVPQRIMGGLAKCFSAVEALVVMGRNRGIGVTLINQRAATLNKDVLTQLDTLLAFRNVAPQDRKALSEWVEAHSADGDFDKFMESLPTLPTGEGWLWSPEFMNTFERIKIRSRETFHPDREKLGDNFVMPELDSQDIDEFIKEFSKESAEAVPKIKSGKKKDVIQVTAEIVPSVNVTALKNEYESKLISKDTEIRQLRSDVVNLQNIIRKVRDVIGAPDGEPSVSSIVMNNDAVSLWQSKLGFGLAGRAFKFISDNPGRSFSREQICLAIGVPTKAGHTQNEFGKLMRTGAVTRNNNLYQLNPNL